MIDFTKILKADMRRLAGVAKARVERHAQEFKEDWEGRFGNDDRIGGELGIPGTAKPLSRVTLEDRADRGYEGTTMLDDPLAEHVATEGQIMDSIELTPTIDDPSDIERGHYNVSAAVTTTHPIFPINEFGLGVPPRTTLLPSNLEVGSQFKERVRRDFEAATGKPMRWRE